MTRATAATAPSPCGAARPRSTSHAERRAPSRSRAFEKGARSRTTRRSPTRRSTRGRCIKEGVPFANGAPNLAVDFPAAWELAREHSVAHRRQGLQDRPDADEDRHRARPQGAHARAPRLVLDQHPRQPRRRGARRSRSPSSRRRSRSSACSSTSSSRSSTRSSTATSSTRSASSTTRRAATPRRAGTTSISSGGSATRCR